MSLSRREFGRLALTAIPGAAVVGRGEAIFGAFAQTQPNSLINGVQVGTITYSYRSMPDQSAEATLKYVLDSGISAIEFMGARLKPMRALPPCQDEAVVRAAVPAVPVVPEARADAAARARARSIRKTCRPAPRLANGTVSSASCPPRAAIRWLPAVRAVAADAGAVR